MAKRRKHGKISMIGKALRTVTGLAGAAVGLGVAFAPVARGASIATAPGASTATIQSGFNAIVYDTTGLDPGNLGGTTLDFSRLVRTAIGVGAGIGIIILFSKLKNRLPRKL